MQVPSNKLENIWEILGFEELNNSTDEIVALPKELIIPDEDIIIPSQRKYSLNGVDKAHEKIEEELIIGCLHDNAYDFRTSIGISGATGIGKSKVEKILEELSNSGFARKSLLRDKNGYALYTYGKNKLGFNEFLALMKKIISSPLEDKF